MKFKIMMLMALLFGIFGSAMANQVILKNTSPHGNPLSVTYQFAYKNAGGPVVFGESEKITLTQSPILVRIHRNQFQLAGVVIQSVDGHPLPGSVNAFDQPRECSMTTNKDKESGSIALSFVLFANKHGKITCATKGGVFGS